MEENARLIASCYMKGDGLLVRCCKCHEIAPPDSYFCEQGHATCPICGKSQTRCGLKAGGRYICGRQLLDDHLYCGDSYTSGSAESSSSSTTSTSDSDIVYNEPRHTNFRKQRGPPRPLELRCLFTKCGSSGQKFSIGMLTTHLKEYHEVPLYQTRSGMFNHFVRDDEKRFEEIGMRRASFLLECTNYKTLFLCSMGMEKVEGIPTVVVILRYFTQKFGNSKIPKFHGSIGLIAKNETIREWSGTIPNATTDEAEVLQKFACLMVPYPKLKLNFQYIRINVAVKDDQGASWKVSDPQLQVYTPPMKTRYIKPTSKKANFSC